MRKWIFVMVLSVAAVCAFAWMLSNSPKIVGKTIRESDFREFYYTYSTTVNPPDFRRYRFYTANGTRMFYHETRAGDKVFPTEEDITVSGELELTDQEWEAFWSCISGGVVENRRESTVSDDCGPWCYLYWNGDRNKCQQFTFADFEKEAEFEAFCAELKSR